MENKEETASEMTLFDHLRELRKRLIISFIAIGAASCLAFLITDEVMAILKAPFDDSFSGFQPIGTGPSEAFMIRLEVALFAGCILASPIVFHQGWKFISPGLYPHERKLLIPFVLVSTALFLTGAYFAYEVMVPMALSFFREQYDAVAISPQIKMTEYLGFIMKAIIGTGAVFEMPVLAYFLGRAGVITDRTLIDGARYAIVIIFIVAAIISPPDVLSQVLLAVPLLILYGISIWVLKATASKEPLPQK